MEDFQRPVVTVQILFNVIIRLFDTLKSMPVKRLKSNKQTVSLRYLNEVRLIVTTVHTVQLEQFIKTLTGQTETNSRSTA